VVGEGDALLGDIAQADDAFQLQPSSPVAAQAQITPAPAPARRGRIKGALPTRARSERIADAQKPREPAAAPQGAATEPARPASPVKAAKRRKRQPTTPSGPAKPAVKRGRRASLGATPRQPQQQGLAVNPIDVDAAMDAANRSAPATPGDTPAPRTPSILQRPRRVSFNVDAAEQSSPYQQHFPPIPPSPEIRPGYAPRPPAGATTRDYGSYNPQTAKYSLTHAELQSMLIEAAQSAAAKNMAELTSGNSQGERFP
jgi:hypothetical protein